MCYRWAIKSKASSGRSTPVSGSNGTLVKNEEPLQCETPPTSVCGEDPIGLRPLSAVAAPDFDTIDVFDLTGVGDVSEPKDSGTETIQSAYKH
jgi:hypothetical protein